MRPPPDDGDRLERRSLTGTARRRRANTYLLHAGVARRRLPRHLARGRYVVAALRAACRSETGAPSLRIIRSRGVRLRQAFSCPAGCVGGRAHGCFSQWGPLTGTARRRRANTYSLTQEVVRSHLPRHLARGRYVVAALRAACRSETGAPSLRAIRSRGVRLRQAFSCPAGCAGGHAWALLPVGAAGMHRRSELTGSVRNRGPPEPLRRVPPSGRAP